MQRKRLGIGQRSLIFFFERNMINENKYTIEDVMNSLRSDRPISIPMLFQLSDLSPDELDHFCTEWSGIEEERRRVIIRHLADISEENFQVDFSEVFSHCLADEAPSVRMASLDGLWDTDRLALIDPIIRLMESDADTEVRSLAAATLGHYVLMGEWQQIPYENISPIVERLIGQIDSEETPQSVKRAALESLGAASHLRVSSLIEQAYDEGDPDMQISAVFAMGRSADARWLPIIIDEMLNPTMEMRIEAARAAGEIGSSDFIPNLAELVWDEELEVRLMAIAAMGQIGGDLAEQVLQDLVIDPEASDVHNAAIEAIEEMGWLDSDIDLSLFDWENDLDNDAFPSA
jgi:HEAT repeat protein